MDKVELTPELLRELQLKQLDMLVYFRDFCEKNNLTFWLIGGGLIGALREGGFVPWDDDVDVMLPREDYEKLPSLWRSVSEILLRAYMHLCSVHSLHMYT